MSRKILIVGAGQSGLQLALGLQQHGYDVTVMSASTPEEIRTGHVRSTQAMFAPALQHEADLGLDFWRNDCPQIDSIQVSIPPQGEGMLGLNWLGRLSAPCQSVDQRVKMSHWLLEFARRASTEDGKGHRTGRGQVIIGGATVSDIRYMAEHKMFDLIIIATGRGELGRMFPIDFDRTPGIEEPLRHLAVTYVHDMGKRQDFVGHNPVGINLLPGAGELFVIPALTTTGPCHILFIEAVPGGPLDKFRFRFRTRSEHLQVMLDLMEEHFPVEHQRAKNAKLTDWGCILTGAVTPLIRKPAGRPQRDRKGSGIVLGMGDVLVRNDPITGQGSNNAAHCAAVYLQAILGHGSRPFDEQFMQDTFDTYWKATGEPVTAWTNAMLQPPPPHVSRILAAAGSNQEIADRFARIFEHPRTAFDWFMDLNQAAAYLDQVRSREATAGNTGM